MVLLAIQSCIQCADRTDHTLFARDTDHSVMLSTHSHGTYQEQSLCGSPGHQGWSARVQHSRSEAVGSSRDLAQPAYKTGLGKAAHWGGLMARGGSGWTQEGWGSRLGMVQWGGWRLRMCGSPADAAQGLRAAPA